MGDDDCGELRAGDVEVPSSAVLLFDTSIGPIPRVLATALLEHSLRLRDAHPDRPAANIFALNAWAAQLATQRADAGDVWKNACARKLSLLVRNAITCYMKQEHDFDDSITARCLWGIVNEHSATDGRGAQGPQNSSLQRGEEQCPRGLIAENVPGDGSCMFHSIGRHLNIPASRLRAQVAQAVARAAGAKVKGVPLADWTAWYADMPAAEYAAHIARPGVWGGWLEMALLARMYKRPIHVYEPTSDQTGCRKISEFDEDDKTPGAPMRLLYMGRSHYMPLFERR